MHAVARTESERREKSRRATTSHAESPTSAGESVDFQIWEDRVQSLCFSSYSRWTRFFSEACFLSRALAAFIA